jgi:hypothetical protein
VSRAEMSPTRQPSSARRAPQRRAQLSARPPRSPGGAVVAEHHNLLQEHCRAKLRVRPHSTDTRERATHALCCCAGSMPASICVLCEAEP